MVSVPDAARPVDGGRSPSIMDLRCARHTFSGLKSVKLLPGLHRENASQRAEQAYYERALAERAAWSAPGVTAVEDRLNVGA
jgi:hypothetical protein